MHVAVGIPQRENGVARIVRFAGRLTLHHRVLTVHIIQHVGVNQCVIYPGIEDSLKIVATPFGYHCRQYLVPCITGIALHLPEIKRRLLTIKIKTGIFGTDKGDTYLHLYLLTLLQIESEPRSYIITRNITAVAGV